MNLPAHLALVCMFSFAASGWASSPGVGSSAQLPFSFVENRGQTDARVRYIGTGPQFKAWFYDDAVAFQQGTAVTRVRFEGAQPRPKIAATEPLGATVNYLRGSRPVASQSNLPLFGAIHYEGVWPGVEIRFKADQAESKAEYVVAPGARVAEIRLRFDGTPTIQADGSLLVRNETGEFREQKPVLYQERGAGQFEVPGAFDQREDGSIGFRVPVYDRTRPLIIDPTILFSGYFGGSAQSTITAVAVNSWYNTIVAGWTIGTDLPAAGGAKPQNAGGVDAFVAGFTPDGGKLLFCTYLGGSGDDRAFGVAVDSANNTYVTGYTSSANFPVAGGVQTKLKGVRDAFVAKLNPSGSALVYSTYLGGTGVDAGNAIVVDAGNSATIIGDTTSTNLPVTAGTFQPSLGGSQDAFVAKLSPSGGSIAWLTYFGGAGVEHGAALSVDSSASVYVAGSTYSTNLPTRLGFQTHSGGGQDGFVARFAPDGSALVFSTYLGGSGGSPGAPETVNAISRTVDGILIVAGTTSSPDFPVTPPVLQAAYGGGQTDGFVTRLNLSTGALMRSTFLGGSGDDGINAVVTDATYLIYVAGYTSSADFPTARPVQAANGGGLDAFVAKIGFSLLLHATYLGGGANDVANAMAIDSLTNLVVAGSTASGNYRTVSGAGSGLGSRQPAALSSFVTKLATGYALAVASMPSILVDIWRNTGYNGPNVTLGGATFGAAGDIPVVGDWDGSGVKKLGLFRNGTWILDTNGNGFADAADRTVVFGQAGDIPVVGDWNGTGSIKLGLFRRGVFIFDLSGHLSGAATGLSDSQFSFGQPGDLPVVADWNGSGTTKAGVFRNGQWLVDLNGTGSPTATYTYGQAGDIPVIGDWNGSGRANEIGVYRNGLWILNPNGDNRIAGAERYQFYLAFGGAGYVPLVF